MLYVRDFVAYDCVYYSSFCLNSTAEPTVTRIYNISNDQPAYKYISQKLDEKKHFLFYIFCCHAVYD